MCVSDSTRATGWVLCSRSTCLGDNTYSIVYLARLVILVSGWMLRRRWKLRSSDRWPRKPTVTIKAMYFLKTLQVWHSRLDFESANSSILEQLHPVKVWRGSFSSHLDVDEIYTSITLKTGGNVADQSLHHLSPFLQITNKTLIFVSQKSPIKTYFSYRHSLIVERPWQVWY